MQTNLIDESFTQEIRLVLREMHISLVAECAVHDGKGMKSERRQFIGKRINPTYGARGLESEACLISKSHREIIRIAAIGQSLHQT